MSSNAPQSQPLTEAQLRLLRLFSRPMSEEETDELSQVLMDFYRRKLDEQVAKDIERKDITRKDFDRILRKSRRTPVTKRPAK
jgi:CBS-domain-containing membrane protein